MVFIRLDAYPIRNYTFLASFLASLQMKTLRES